MVVVVVEVVEVEVVGLVLSEANGDNSSKTFPLYVDNDGM